LISPYFIIALSHKETHLIILPASSRIMVILIEYNPLSIDIIKIEIIYG